MKNEILEELWKSKDDIAKKYNYNIRRIVTELKRKEKKENVPIVDFSKGEKTASSN
jgi:hypothetical protein